MPDVRTSRSDEELVGLAVGGDRGALDEIVTRYEGKLLGFVYRRVGQRETAEDIVQETFIKAFRNLPSFDNKYRFSTWVYTIATRLTVSYYRSRAAKPLTSRAEVEMVDNETPDRQVEITDMAKRVWDLAEEHLSEQQHEALVLRFREDLPVADIANIMGVSVSNAKVLLHRGRKALGAVIRATETACITLEGTTA